MAQRDTGRHGEDSHLIFGGSEAVDVDPSADEDPVQPADPADSDLGTEFEHHRHESAWDPSNDEAGPGFADPHVSYAGRHEFGRSAAAERGAARQRRAGILIALAAVLLVVISTVAYLSLRSSLSVKDYAGNGTGTVSVRVDAGDTASDIAATLLRDGVVKSVKAFTNAANANSASEGIQPGIYVLHHHMSGKAALTLMLNPASRSAAGDVVVIEGATTVDVASRLATTLGMSTAAVLKAINDPSGLGLPSTYRTASGGVPTSVEGFLYPATYAVDAGSKVDDVLTQMIDKYIQEDRATGFAAGSRTAKLTPYDALIIASIAQSEAKFPADMPKVARVILNRIAAGQPLQVDATSAYAAKLRGLDPSKVDYATIDSPYNSYTHPGLPPTPISNPGAEALAAASHPAAGNWLYYVNADAAGHLFFTNSDPAFEAAKQKCAQMGWGCASS